MIEELAGEFRLLCPDLRGLGWSGPPDDDDFRKQRMADDAIALLDVLGLEQVRLAGHDWGAYAAILAALTAPERFSSVLAMSIGHPWVPTEGRRPLRLPARLPAPARDAVRGERVVRDGTLRARDAQERPARRPATGPTRSSTPTSTCCASPLSPTRRRSSTATSSPARSPPPRPAPSAASTSQVPARLLIGSREPFRAYSADFPGELDVVDGAGHFVLEEVPQAVAERIRAM